MAVVEVTERFHGKGSLDSSPVENLTRIYHVRTNAVTDDFSIVKLGTGVPRIGDVHSNNPAAFVINLSGSLIDSDNDPFNWEVEVNYTTQLGGANPPPDNPLLEPAQISWGLTSRTVVVNNGRLKNETTGVYGSVVAVKNAAGDRFDPAPEADIYDRTLTIVRNEASFDPSTLDTFTGKVNSMIFFGAAPGSIRFFGASASSGFQNGVSFWRVSYQFGQRLPTWAMDLLNVGYNEIIGGEKRKIVFSNGEYTTIPQPLDTAGKYVENPATEPIFLDYKIFEDADFNLLNLP